MLAGRLIGTHAHEVMSIVQHLMSHCDEEAGSKDKPVQVSLFSYPVQTLFPPDHGLRGVHQSVLDSSLNI